MNDSDLTAALDSLKHSLVRRSALDTLIEATEVAARESCRQEAYEQLVQSRDLTPTQREGQLSRRCQVLTQRLKQSIRVSRYLYSLINEDRQGVRAKDDPATVLSRCPRNLQPDGLHTLRPRRRCALVVQSQDAA